jgi:anti-anti-sigma factor
LFERIRDLLDIDSRSNATIINVTSDLDIGSAYELEAAIEGRRTSVKPIVVSLADCPYCDSSGLSIFVRMKKRLGSRFAVVVPERGKCYRVFELTTLHTILPVYPTIEAAIDSFVQEAAS